MNYACIYHVLRMGLEFGAKEKAQGKKWFHCQMYLFIITQNRGWVGNSSWKWCRERKGWVYVVNMFMFVGPRMARVRTRAQGEWQGVKHREMQVFVAHILLTQFWDERGLHNFTGLHSMGNQTSLNTGILSFGVSRQKILTFSLSSLWSHQEACTISIKKVI